MNESKEKQNGVAKIKKSKVSAAKQAANARWNKKNYDRFYLTVKKGVKAELFAHADEMGESLNHFINRAIQTQLAIDASDPEKIKDMILDEKRLAEESKRGVLPEKSDETNTE